MILISEIWPKPDDFEREQGAFQRAHLYRYHRNKEIRRKSMVTEEQSLEVQVATFLADLVHANHSPQTRRAYASDLVQLCAFHQGPIQTITAEVLRKFFETHTHLRPATRARKQAAVARFLTWAEQQELLTMNPMRRIDRVKLDPPPPRGVERSQIERILKAIPAEHLRDRLFFRLLAETGLRVSEGLSLYVEDLDLSLDNEHLTVVGKGGKRRTILLDDSRLVQQLRAYLKRMGYQHGPLFRAEKNGRGGPLRYQSMQERWDRYCSQAGVACTLHQLRHSHATELINGGVSLPTIRKRLGHKNLQTTLRYAEQSDGTADAEVRAWRRQHPSSC
jgi:integrase/recombinase XerD